MPPLTGSIMVTGVSWGGNRLASHWPCVTDTVVYPPTGLTAKDREMSTPAYVHSGRGTFMFTFTLFAAQCNFLQINLLKYCFLKQALH